VQAGTLGYWVGQPHAGKGTMTAALRVLLPTLFGELNLHRIEAACIPTNQSSIRVLENAASPARAGAALPLHQWRLAGSLPVWPAG
jgi:ribosomal-protein-alanine N-acetyltransferase